MNACTDTYFEFGLHGYEQIKKISCFSKLKNGSFDLLIDERPLSVVCYEVFPRAKGVFENILMMDVLAENFDPDQVQTKWINFSGRFYSTRIHKMESCGSVYKYKLKAIIPEKDFWV
jgi:hypothetical protein